MCWCMRYLASNSTKTSVKVTGYTQNRTFIIRRSMLRLDVDLITRAAPCDSDVGSFVFLSRTLVRCNFIIIVVEYDSY